MNTNTSIVTTKRIAREAGLPVAAVNQAARDLGIADYRSDLRSWVVPASTRIDLVAHLVAHLVA